jgi:methyl-accepting chemotaxis protein
VLSELSKVRDLQVEIEGSITSITANSEQIAASSEQNIAVLSEVGEALQSVAKNVYDVSLVAEELNNLGVDKQYAIC